MVYPVKVTRKIEFGVHLIAKAAAIIAEIALAAMMLLTVADVFGRYFLNKPIIGSYEIVGLLLICAGTWGWAYCQLEKRHISISFVTERFSLRARSVLSCLAYFIGFVGFSIICWRVFLLAEKYISLAKGGTTMTLGIPFYPFLFVLSIGAGLMALILMVDFIRSIFMLGRARS
jgi:TRAP-type transport system small permease protein